MPIGRSARARFADVDPRLQLVAGARRLGTVLFEARDAVAVHVAPGGPVTAEDG